jgi:hypothetical protein
VNETKFMSVKVFRVLGLLRSTCSRYLLAAKSPNKLSNYFRSNSTASQPRKKTPLRVTVHMGSTCSVALRTVSVPNR